MGWNQNVSGGPKEADGSSNRCIWHRKSREQLWGAWWAQTLGKNRKRDTQVKLNCFQWWGLCKVIKTRWCHKLVQDAGVTWHWDCEFSGGINRHTWSKISCRCTKISCQWKLLWQQELGPGGTAARWRVLTEYCYWKSENTHRCAVSALWCNGRHFCLK